jgi:hypothetical protein
VLSYHELNDDFADEISKHSVLAAMHSVPAFMQHSGISDRKFTFSAG